MKRIFLTYSMCLLMSLGHSHAASWFTNGVDLSSGWYDVNKVRDDYGEDHDSALCWAASASNILQWWQDQLVADGRLPEGTPDGYTAGSIYSLDIFEVGVNNFTNHGFNTLGYWSWWLEGKEGLRESDRLRLRQDSNGGGYFSGYYAMPQIQCTVLDSLDENILHVFTQGVLNALQDGCGITLEITTGMSGHAITLWGLEIDDLTGLATHLYITDSDDALPGNRLENSMLMVPLEMQEYYYEEWDEDGNLVYRDESLIYHDIVLTGERYGEGSRHTWHILQYNTLGMFFPIPEPSSGLLVALSGSLIAGIRRRRH